MNKKKMRNIVITGIATVAGVFGGFKVYSNKKKRILSVSDVKKENGESTNQ